VVRLKVKNLLCVLFDPSAGTSIYHLLHYIQVRNQEIVDQDHLHVLGASLASLISLGWSQMLFCMLPCCTQEVV
jgi:hypothetical protein